VSLPTDAAGGQWATRQRGFPTVGRPTAVRVAARPTGPPLSKVTQLGAGRPPPSYDRRATRVPLPDPFVCSVSGARSTAASSEIAAAGG